MRKYCAICFCGTALKKNIQCRQIKVHKTDLHGTARELLTYAGKPKRFLVFRLNHSATTLIQKSFECKKSVKKIIMPVSPVSRFLNGWGFGYLS